MKKLMWTVISGGALLLASQIFSAYTAEKEGKYVDNYYSQHIKDNYKVFSLVTPNTLTLGDEIVPLQIEDVREKMDRELLVNTYWHSNTFLLHKRANQRAVDQNTAEPQIHSQRRVPHDWVS